MIKQSHFLAVTVMAGALALCSASAQASMFGNIVKKVEFQQQQQIRNAIASRRSMNQLNPQPLPPAQKYRNGSLVQLNPQPLPPVQKFRNGSLVQLNPQPLPPVQSFRNSNFARLNPQPLPPAAKLMVRSR